MTLIPPGPLTTALAALVLLYAPGRALFPASACALPTPLFARVLASCVWTTLAGTALAAFGSFSLASLLAANLAFAGAALLGRRVLRAADAGSSPPPRFAPRDYAGGLVVVAALAAYWPGYPAFLGASDSSAYLATGVSLAHHGRLSRHDDLGPTVPPETRALLFDSMSQVFGTPGPPYRRMPGAMLVESLDSDEAWPSFFPVPSVWSAVFVAAGAPGSDSAEQAAPGYAPVFAALALWAFWHLARSWLAAPWSLLAVGLLAASGPFYYFARMPLSEPVAAYFALAALAVLSRCSPRPRAADALLAAAALGAAVFTRVEIALLLVLASALQPILRRDPNGGSGDLGLPASFYAVLAAAVALTAVQASLIPGTWALPFGDHVRNAWINYQLHIGRPSLGREGVGAGILLALAAVAVRRLGWKRAAGWAVVLGALAAHRGASNFLYERTPMWLSFYVGWQGIVLAAAGLALAWRRRDLPPAATVVTGLAIATSLILFYNPHVYPALPWGARRFVPLLLPLMILLACYAASRLALRSRVVAAVAAATLLYAVVQGGRPFWGKVFAEGAWEQLAGIEKVVPDDGTLLVDRNLSPLMAGPALWLIHDRNGLPVPGPDTAAGRETLPGLVSHYAAKGPVYLVTRSTSSGLRAPRLAMKMIGRATTALRFLEQKYDTLPRQSQRYVLPVGVYRLEPSDDPSGTILR